MHRELSIIILVMLIISMLYAGSNAITARTGDITIQPLITQTVNITNGTLILPHLEKWVFWDNQSYIYFRGNGVYVPFPPAGEYILVNITDGVADYSLPLNLTGVIPDGYGIVNVTYNGNTVGYWVENAWDKVWVKLPANGNYTLRIDISQGTNNMGDPDQAFLFYDGFGVFNSSVWDYTGSMSVSTSNGVLTIQGTSSSSWGLMNTKERIIDTSKPYGYVVEERVRVDSDSAYFNIGIDDRLGNTYIGNGVDRAVMHNEGQPEWDVSRDNSETTVSRSIDASNWGILKIVWDKNWVGFYWDNQLNANITSNVPQDSMDVRYEVKGRTIYVDWVRVRLYVDSPPSYNTSIVRIMQGSITYPFELGYYRLNDTSNNTVFLADPLFYNCSNYFDIISWDTGVVHGNVSRVADNSTWFWVFNNYYNDSMVHLLFFPVNTLVRFEYANGTIARDVVVNDTNPILIDLDSGVYNVVLYGYVYSGGTSSSCVYNCTNGYVYSTAYPEKTPISRGEPINLFVVYKYENGTGVSGLNVTGVVYKPLGDNESVNFSYIGNGTYKAYYVHTNELGRYAVNITAAMNGPSVSTMLYFDVNVLGGGLNFKTIYNSSTSVALTDGLLSFALTVIGVIGLAYWYRKHRLFNLLLLGIALTGLGLVLLAVRSNYVDYIQNINGTIKPHYAVNPYARLYLAPIYTGILVLGVYIVSYISRTARRVIHS